MVYGWNISLSYDGKTYSSHVTMLIFDGQVNKCDAQTLVCSSFNQMTTDSSTDTNANKLLLMVGATTGLLVVVIITTIIVVLKKSNRYRKSVVSTINVSRDPNLPIPKDETMFSEKIQNDLYHTKVVSELSEKSEVSGLPNVHVFLTPSSSRSPKVTIPPLGHCMNLNEHNSLTIESFD
ncbi:uncharacterized protein LOC134229887 [Saccostrea cucullata]|uniref:uncharacterized protein LOC134229887 n=1 Tax=Saccostrea cuccullata TaxID=36930 RepID=UPI002ED0DC42